MALIDAGPAAPAPPAVAVARRRLPDPGEPVPEVAEPTVALYSVALALFVASTAHPRPATRPPG